MDILNRYKIYDRAYYDCIKELIDTNIVKQMNEYIQHGTTTTLEHVINVSYSSYKIAKKFKMDYKSAARAGLLHDFYLYDWHTTKVGNKLFELHGYTHPKKAYENAKKYFEINNLEKDIITKHMWPLTFTKIPAHRESIVVSLVDKYISTKEIVRPYLFFIKKAK